MKGKLMERCRKMKDVMKAQEVELTEHVVQMNCAREASRKMSLMAAVLTHMVEQRITMDARKAKIQGEMMKHMQMGEESMSHGPMMKGMKGMDERSGDAQKEPK